MYTKYKYDIVFPKKKDFSLVDCVALIKQYKIKATIGGIKWKMTTSI